MKKLRITALALCLSVALCALKIVRSRKPDEIEIELDEK